MGVLVFAVLSIALIAVIPASYGAALPKDNQTVSIQLSKTCQVMLMNNVTTDCPSYKDLMDLGWDESLPGTGEFYYDDTGFYKRGMPQYKKVHELYRYDDYRILIDPPSEIASRTKLIIVNVDLPVYIPLGEYVKENHVRVLAKDRYVEDCHIATITSSGWKEMISDTVYYLRNGCNQTKFTEQYTVEDYISSMKLETSQAYKNRIWLEESKQKCKTICKEY